MTQGTLVSQGGDVCDFKELKKKKWYRNKNNCVWSNVTLTPIWLGVKTKHFNENTGVSNYCINLSAFVNIYLGGYIKQMVIAVW